MYRVYLYENLLDFKREKDMKAFIWKFERKVFLCFRFYSYFHTCKFESPINNSEALDLIGRKEKKILHPFLSVNTDVLSLKYLQ